MAEVLQYSVIQKGDMVSGFSDLEYLNRRTLRRFVSISSNSPRVHGKLQLRANDYEISSHNLVFRPFSSRERRVTRINGKRVYYYSINAYQNRYRINQWYDYSSHEDPSNKALIKLHDKKMEGAANMAVTFAERQDAIDMIASKATNLFNAYRNIKRGKVKRAMVQLGLAKDARVPRSKQASGQWLELQYGWMPLVSDIYAYSNLSPFAGARIYGIASATSMVGEGNQQTTCTRLVKYGADVLIADPMLAFGNSLGLLNPALVAWELVPFSFVVDWFLPIGDHLSYLTSDIGISYKNAYKSTLDEVSIYYNEPRVYTSDGHNYTESEGCLGTYSNFKRAAISKPPLPDLTYKNPLSPMHLANAIALGRQLKD